MLKGGVGETGFDAAAGEEGECSCCGRLALWRRSREGAVMICRREPAVFRLRLEVRDRYGLGVVCRVIEHGDRVDKVSVE